FSRTPLFSILRYYCNIDEKDRASIMSLTSPYEPLRGLTIQRVASALSADRPKTPFFRGARPPLGVVCHPKRWKRLKVRIPPLSGPQADLHRSGTFPGLSCRTGHVDYRPAR